MAKKNKARTAAARAAPPNPHAANTAASRALTLAANPATASAEALRQEVRRLRGQLDNWEAFFKGEEDTAAEAAAAAGVAPPLRADGSVCPSCTLVRLSETICELRRKARQG